MKALILGGLLCLALVLNASALTINFSGEVTAATAGNFGFDVGDSFSGYVSIDDSNPNAPMSQQFLGAGIYVEGAPWTISFISWTMQGISISPTMIALSGNPHQFWATLTVFLDNGVVTGGTASANSETFMDHGYFEGVINPSISAASQPVPDSASALGLLALGCAAIFGSRFHRVRV